MKLLFEGWRKFLTEVDTDGDGIEDERELAIIDPGEIAPESPKRYRVGDEGSREGQKPLGSNYHLGRYHPRGPTVLQINFRNLKKPGENIPGGVDPNKISELIEQAFYDNNADYFLHHPFVKVDNTGGGGYIDPSRSKYKVFLKFDDEEQYEDFKTKELDLIMKQINQASADYEMNLRQMPLLQH